MSVGKKIHNSSLELKNINSLAGIAMLLALRVVLGFFANTTLAMFGGTIKISGAFLPIAAAGVIFGPVPAALVGGLGDIISFLISPTGFYFPGVTINGILTGLIYGLFFYKNSITIRKTIAAWFLNTLTVETFIMALWLFILQIISGAGEVEKTYFVYLTARFISQAVKCVPEIILIFAIGRLVARIKLPQKKRIK